MFCRLEEKQVRGSRTTKCRHVLQSGSCNSSLWGKGDRKYNSRWFGEPMNRRSCFSLPKSRANLRLFFHANPGTSHEQGQERKWLCKADVGGSSMTLGKSALFSVGQCRWCYRLGWCRFTVNSNLRIICRITHRKHQTGWPTLSIYHIFQTIRRTPSPKVGKNNGY